MEKLVIFSGPERPLPTHPLLRRRGLMSLTEKVDNPLTQEELIELTKQTEDPAYVGFARSVLRHRPTDWKPQPKPPVEPMMTEEELVRALQSDRDGTS